MNFIKSGSYEYCDNFTASLIITLIFGEDKLIGHESASDASLVEFKTHSACISFADKFIGMFMDRLSLSLEYRLPGL